MISLMYSPKNNETIYKIIIQTFFLWKYSTVLVDFLLQMIIENT